MDKWDSPFLRALAPDPGSVASEALSLLALPTSPELSALIDDGVATLDAALAVGEPAILADFLGYATTRLRILAAHESDLCQPEAAFRSLIRDRLSGPDAQPVKDFIERAAAMTQWSPPGEPHPDEFGPIAKRYLTLTLQGRGEDARALVQEVLQNETSIGSVILDVLEAAQHELGRRWQVGEITVAQEHYCTAVTQMVLTDLYPHLFAGAGGSRRLVAVDAPGSLHQVGLRMVADLLENQGWATTYIASSDPEAILAHIVEHQAAVLAISASMPDQILDVRALINAVRADPRSRDLKILVGGRPFTVAPDLVSVVGADDVATSAADAVAVCNRLVPDQR